MTIYTSTSDTTTPHGTEGTPLPWCDPVVMFQAIGATYPTLAFLHSTMDTGFSGRYSLLAYDEAERVEAEHFSALEPKLTRDQAAFANAWFGYLGYELKHDLETLPHDAPMDLGFPRLWMVRYKTVLVWDHAVKKVVCYGNKPSLIPHPSPLPEGEGIHPPTIHSSQDYTTYLNNIATIQQGIAEGDLYQANLTRKISGTWEKAPDAALLFLALCEASPAPYSAFFKDGAKVILSSSPEQFLTITADGKVVSRPIKGSAARSDDPAQDAALKATLCTSEKDRAENLMIVDLMRNDLSRTALAGTVQVENLFEVTSYATVHHMASTITAQQSPEASTLDVVKACFPPGSMTGAPKIKAMEYCSRLEGIERGVYSGAIGWFGGDGSCDLSVVIRTLLIEGNRFEFQVGGAIVTDSDPHAEWEETRTKARAIARVLGVNV
jgi:aminodeoxychorismate synthase component I